MPKTRERWIERIRESLERSGFYVAVTHGVRPSSFDIAARRDATLLLIKVLKNIDALDAEEARRLLDLGTLFPAIVLLVGLTSGASELEPGVVYTRYGVPIITEETLQEYLDKALPPFLYASPGGRFARIDGVRLRGLRLEQGLSLGTLAGIAGVSRRAIQLYEDGAGAEASVIERIEEHLGEPIVRPIDLFTPPPHTRPGQRTERSRTSDDAKTPATDRPLVSTGDPLRDGVLQQLEGMGLEVVVTVRAPFDAVGRTPEILLAAVGSLRSALHRAEVLQGLARVAEGHAMFVVRDGPHRSSIAGMAILTVTELKRHHDRDDLLEEIEEREGP